MGEILKKEIVRVFKDPKMVLSIFVLPVVLMIGLMYLMGTFMSNMEQDIEEHTSIVYCNQESEDFLQYLNSTSSNYEIRVMDDEHRVKEDIKNGAADLLLVFSDKFDAKVKAYKEGDLLPEIKMFYNPSEEYSNAAYSEFSQMLEGYREMLLSKRVGNLEQLMIFRVNADQEEIILQDEKKASGKALGTMLPYFVTLMLFAGAMSIGTDMIAGEKERGTMASLLVTPLKRSAIIYGKVFALMIISGLASLVSTIAIILCMPFVSKTMLGTSLSNINMSLDFGQIVMLGTLLVAIAFLYSTIITFVSVFAKTVKEANSYVMPVYIIVMAIGLMTMYMQGEPEQAAYFIPIYNSAIVLKGILVHEVTMLQFFITLFITLGIGGILVVVIAKAFESEKVMAG